MKDGELMEPGVADDCLGVFEIGDEKSMRTGEKDGVQIREDRFG